MAKWKSYEEVARAVLSDLRTVLGIASVEGKQDLPAFSGTSFEVEGKALLVEGEGFLIVEARRHTKSRIKQEAMGAIAYRIQDTGAAGVIVVSPLPLQKGAKLVADFNKIKHVK